MTLEPGGQFELSGAPVSTLHQTCAEVNQHLYQVWRLEAPFAAAPQADSGQSRLHLRRVTRGRSQTALGGFAGCSITCSPSASCAAGQQLAVRRAEALERIC